MADRSTVKPEGILEDVISNKVSFCYGTLFAADAVLAMKYHLLQNHEDHHLLWIFIYCMLMWLLINKTIAASPSNKNRCCESKTASMPPVTCYQFPKIVLLLYNLVAVKWLISNRSFYVVRAICYCDDECVDDSICGYRASSDESRSCYFPAISLYMCVYIYMY